MSKTGATLCLFLTAIIWGIAFTAQVAGMEYVGPFTYGGVRFALGALSLIPVAAVFERGGGDMERRRLTLFAGVGAGAVLFLATSLQQAGIVITGSAGKAGFITGLYTVIVPIFGIFLGKKSPPLTWAGALLAVIGLYLLSAAEGLSSVGAGDLALLACAVFWAVHIMLIDRFSGRINPLRLSVIQFAVCSALSLICAFIFEDVTLAGIIACRVPILYGGIFSAGIAYTLQIVGQQKVEPAKAAIIFSLESLFSAVGGALILGETMTPRGYAGCALILTGIIASQLQIPKSKKFSDFFEC